MPVTFRLSQSRTVPRSGASEDVSPSGMRLLTNVHIPVGERLKIDCPFCSAVAVVKSLRPHDGPTRGRWQCGVEFLTFRLTQARGGLFSTVA
jgi:hypothetical protein